MGAAGRRGASPGFIYAPLGSIFSTFVGSLAARGANFRERWTFENWIGALCDSLVFIFLSLRWPVMEIFVLRTLFRRGVQNPW